MSVMRATSSKDLLTGSARPTRNGVENSLFAKVKTPLAGKLRVS